MSGWMSSKGGALLRIWRLDCGFLESQKKTRPEYEEEPKYEDDLKYENCLKKDDLW